MTDTKLCMTEETFTIQKVPTYKDNNTIYNMYKTDKNIISNVNNQTKPRLKSERKHVRTVVFPANQSVTSLRDNFNEGTDKTVRNVSRNIATKNEAEIIDDLPMNQIRSSFSVISGVDKLEPVSIGCSGSRSRGLRRRSSSESLDSDLRNVRKNNIESRRYQKVIGHLDRQSSAGAVELQQKINEVFKDYNKILQRSPTTDEWLLLKKSRKNMLQERERENIAKRYSRRERQFRAPPELHDAVSKIRTYAMMEAGLKHDAETIDSVDRDLMTAMNAMNLSRRHTISGDLVENFPQINTTQPPRFYPSYGRRMTLADTRVLQSVLEVKTENMLNFYVDSFLQEKMDITELDKNSDGDNLNTGSDGEVGVTETE